jgi:hypothetical protein
VGLDDHTEQKHPRSGAITCGDLPYSGAARLQHLFLKEVSEVQGRSVSPQGTEARGTHRGRFIRWLMGSLFVKPLCRPL